jgi:L-fuconolactonase
MIDSHHHLWKYNKAEYDWIPEDSPLAKDHLLEQLENETSSAEVSGTVVVQARQTLAESKWLLNLADQSDMIAGVIGWAPLMEYDVSHTLSYLAACPKFRGVRHVLQNEPDTFFLSDDFHRGLSLLPDLDLRYDLLVFQRQLSVALKLVDRQADLGIIIDHLAKPEIHNGKINPAWKAGMTELAKRDNILGVKISGLVNEVLDAEIDEPTLRAYFDETLEIFGSDRLMFGSDWPVCLLRIDSYQKWADMVRGFVSRLSSDESDAILHDNAVRIYAL